MTGRGIDQVLHNPSDPRIHEPFVKNARGYVELAERSSGPSSACRFLLQWKHSLLKCTEAS